MTFDSWINLVGVVGLPLAGWVFAYARARADEIRREAEAQAKAQARMHQQLQSYAERVNRELYDFRLDVAQRYATMIALREIEQRFLTAVERFEDKLDRWVALQNRVDG